MPKPSRRERRRLAEQGKLAPRRMAPASLPHGTAIEPRERVNVGAVSPVTAAPDTGAPIANADEYAYVKSDLRRILLLAGTLVALMLALKFILLP